MAMLPRRYVLVATFIVLAIIFLVYSPHARERASLLRTKYNVPWLSSQSNLPPLEANSDVVEEQEPSPSISHPPPSSPGSLFSDLFPGSSSSSALYHNTAITESRLPLQEAGAPHTPGFTYFQRLYVWNETIYAVLSEEKRKMFPELKHILSKGVDMDSQPDMNPTDKEMQIITPEEAKRVLGTRAAVIEGTSFVLYDTKQFMNHYYHWWGEIILGAIRVYSSIALLPSSQSSDSSTYMPDPDRFILPNVLDHSWRDHAGINAPLMRAAFPPAAIERKDFWQDLLDVEQPFVLERGMIISRIAAHQSPLSAKWGKMIGSTMQITPAPNFWEPLRRRVITNMVGYLPIQDASGKVVEPSSSSSTHATQPDPSRFGSTKPLVLYISRQNHGRRLTSESNESLEKAMREVCDGEGLCEFEVAHMEDWAFRKQLEGASRSVIMIGVHGNGLTHQIWMPPSKRSTVIEIFYPKTYLHDYSMLARNVGHKHYAIWNDTYLTFSEGETFDGVEGGTRDTLHGNSIPVHGPTVAGIVRQQLTEKIH